MPGRAQQMSPSQAHQMTTSKFGVPMKVLQNKKALDLAFQKHLWEMQGQAKNLASGEKKTKMAGEYGLKQQEMRNKTNASSNIETKILQQAVKMAQDSLVDLNTEEGQQQFQQIYQTLLDQVRQGESGEGTDSAGAGSLASGGAVNPSGMTFSPKKPGMTVNPLNREDRKNSVMSKWMEKRKGGRAGSSAKSSYKEGVTAVNPQTGERLVYKNGKWQPQQ